MRVFAVNEQGESVERDWQDLTPDEQRAARRALKRQQQTLELLQKGQTTMRSESQRLLDEQRAAEQEQAQRQSPWIVPLLAIIATCSILELGWRVWLAIETAIRFNNR